MREFKTTFRRKKRWELAAVAAFVLVNLAVPLVIEDFFPFTTTPMFRDRPRYYSIYTLNEIRSDSVIPLENDTLASALAALELNRTYDGNPAGLGVGQMPPATLDRFTDSLNEQPSEEEVRRHVQARLEKLPSMSGVEVVREIVGPREDGTVGVIRKERWRVMRSGANP